MTCFIFGSVLLFAIYNENFPYKNVSNTLYNDAVRYCAMNNVQINEKFAMVVLDIKLRTCQYYLYERISGSNKVDLKFLEIASKYNPFEYIFSLKNQRFELKPSESIELSHYDYDKHGHLKIVTKRVYENDQVEMIDELNINLLSNDEKYKIVVGIENNAAADDNDQKYKIEKYKENVNSIAKHCDGVIDPITMPVKNVMITLSEFLDFIEEGNIQQKQQRQLRRPIIYNHNKNAKLSSVYLKCHFNEFNQPDIALKYV